MKKDDNPYTILGVPYDVEENELKKVYRKLALKYHPDRQVSEGDKEKAHDNFARIASAYDTLTDPVKRYDWKLANEKAMLKALKTKQRNDTKPVTTTQTTTINHAIRQVPRRQSTMPSQRVNGTTTAAGVGTEASNPKRRLSLSPNKSSTKNLPSKSRGAAAGRKASLTSSTTSELRPVPPPKSQEGRRPLHSLSCPATIPTTSSPSSTLSTRGANGLRVPVNGPSPSSSSTSSTTTTKSSSSLSSSKGGLMRASSSHVPTSSSLAGRGGGATSTLQPKLKRATSLRMPPTSTTTTLSTKHSSGNLGCHPNKETKNHTLGAASTGTGSRATATPSPTKTRRVSGGKVHPSSTPHTATTNCPQPQQPHVTIRNTNSNRMNSTSGSSGQNVIHPKSKECHNPYRVFELKLKEHFEEDYLAADWMPTSTSSDQNTLRILQAKSKGDPKNPQTVVSMTTSTRKERRADNLKLYDVKTVTKLLKLNGTVQKISETSIVDEEHFHAVHANTITITREQALSKQRIKSTR